MNEFLDFIIKYWLQVTFGGLLTIGAVIGNHFKNKLSKRLCEHDALKLGVQALLRTEIIKSYNYYKDKGHCPIYAKDGIAAMGKAYHMLGGNGTTPGLLEEINDMPTEKKYCKTNLERREEDGI